MDAASMTLGRGGLGLFDKLHDRGFPSRWRFQEFRDVNLPAIRTRYVRPVLFRPAHMAAEYIGKRSQIGLTGLGTTEPLGGAPTATQPNKPVRADIARRCVEIGRCVPPQHQRFSELWHNPQSGDVGQKCAELRSNTRMTLFELVEIFLLRNGEGARGGALLQSHLIDWRLNLDFAGRSDRNDAPFNQHSVQRYSRQNQQSAVAIAPY